MMRLVFLGLAAVAAMMLGGATAQAGLISGGASFSGTPQNASSGTVLDTRNVTAVTKTAGSLDFTQAPNFTTTWADFVLTTPMPTGGGFVLSNATFGTFTSSALLSDTLATEIVAGNGNRTITYKGFFSAGSLFAANIRDATDANLTITLNQSTTNGNTFFSNTMTLTASGVPEPTSIALVGLVALGLVVRRFRRK
ncbi:MAG: PEP-CTERM sorting domain-containing protein [Pirellula sp.]|nr:PEP-CTERM sorting domain-containing protein [Pirellula sp.]